MSSPPSLSWFRLAERAAAIGFLFVALNKLRKLKLDQLITVIPGAAGALHSTIDSETRAAVATMFPVELTESQTLTIPKEGRNFKEVMGKMESYQKYDPKKGRIFGYMYDSCEEEYEKFIKEVFVAFMHENGLNPTAFPALRKFEVEVVQMTLNMFHAPPSAVGTMTSGGTESLLCAVKSYRDRAREFYPHITKPEIVMSASVHVAVPKACKYFDCTPVFVDMDDEMKMSLHQTESVITKNTILIIASAPQYPHGIVDPIVELGEIAVRRNLPLHVDACMGGYLLPWVEKLGYPVPLFDFRVLGVTSISADVHKYGYAAKGASTLSWISQEFRKFQFYAFAQWPGGMFVSPSMLGTRSGGSIAAAWAALVSNGESGYLRKAKALMEASKKMQEGIERIREMKILGKPHMSIIAWTTKPEYSHEINVFAVADVMEKRFHFQVERQQYPTCLHVTLTPPHLGLVDEFVDALKQSIALVRAHPELRKEGSAATYGLVAKIPSNAVVDQFLVAFLDKVLQPSATPSNAEAKCAAQGAAEAERKS